MKLRWLLPLAIVPLGVGIGAWQGYRWWTWSIAPQSDRPDAIVRIEIPAGTPAQQIGIDLETAGAIRSAQAWSLWVRWKAWQSDEGGGFQAGTYDIDTSETAIDIAEQIWSGEVVEQRFTIPEGRSISDMAVYFEREGFFSAEAFTEAANTIPREDYPWLPDNIPNLEGFLYPDTYQAAAETLDPEGVVRQMLDRFESVALPVYEATDSDMTLLEWVTLGSIVEKEAVVAEERRRIAGVFTQRLQKGMKLASDPTVEYGLGIRQTVDKPLTYAQVETPSSYNTYMNLGLPPGPITSPGIASLEATLDPEDTEFLFFTARYDGTHIFSRTLAEHEAAIARVERDLETRDVE